MLLSLITFAAMMLFGSWMFVAIAPRTKKDLSTHPTLSNKKISLYSLIFLLFFYHLPAQKSSQESFGKLEW